MGCTKIGTAELTNSIAALPQDIRDDLHIYFINSPLDVPHLGRLGDVAGYVRKAGFQNVSYRHFPDGNALANDLLQLREENPSARLALVGWSGGSLAVWDAATTLAAEQQVVDCVIYLDSNWIKKRIAEQGHPDNIIRIVLIYNETRDPPDGLPTANVYRVNTSNHLAVPAHPQAVEALINELKATATQSRL